MVQICKTRMLPCKTLFINQIWYLWKNIHEILYNNVEDLIIFFNSTKILHTFFWINRFLAIMVELRNRFKLRQTAKQRTKKKKRTRFKIRLRLGSLLIYPAIVETVERARECKNQLYRLYPESYPLGVPRLVSFVSNATTIPEDAEVYCSPYWPCCDEFISEPVYLLTYKQIRL